MLKLIAMNIYQCTKNKLIMEITFGVSKLIELIGSKNLQKLKMLNILKKRWTLNGLKMEV